MAAALLHRVGRVDAGTHCVCALGCCRCTAGTGLGSGVVQAGTLQGEMNGIMQNRIQGINQMC